MIRLLKKDEAVLYREELKKLLRVCKSGSGEQVSDSFLESKLVDLYGYLENDRAYLAVKISGESPIGFIWGCEILRETQRRFHVLYFAVDEMYQGQGIGTELLNFIYNFAENNGFDAIELNVHSHNISAKAFYEKSGFTPERISMLKPLR